MVNVHNAFHCHARIWLFLDACSFFFTIAVQKMYAAFCLAVICLCRWLIQVAVCVAGPVASIFWLDKELGSDVYLDGKFVFYLTL